MLGTMQGIQHALSLSLGYQKLWRGPDEHQLQMFGTEQVGQCMLSYLRSWSLGCTQPLYKRVAAGRTI
jgi:hypothetical protein